MTLSVADWLLLAVRLLPFAGLALVVLYVGYVAYETRLVRERRALEPPFDPRAPVQEMARLNARIAAEAREGHASLAKARETLRRGIRG